MAELLFGAETEYAAAGRRGGAGLPGEETAVEILRAAGAQLTHLQDLNSSGMYLTNAARFYIDCGTHPEYSTPECSNPWDLVRQVEAGHRIMARLAHTAKQRRLMGKQILVFRSNVDYSGTGSTWGTHESYLYRGSGDAMRTHLVPHLATRPIYTGAGGYHPGKAGLEFTLAPRLTYFTVLDGDSAGSSRCMWNTRLEPLSTKYKRLHVVCGESLCSQTALFLKFGTTALIAAMTDAGHEPGARVALAYPVEAMHTVIGDVTLRAKLELRRGGSKTAIEVQRHYLEMAEEFSSAEFMPPWTSEVCRVWRWVLERLDEGPEAVSKTLDWAIKHSLYAVEADRVGIDSLALDAMASNLSSTVHADPDEEDDLQQSLFTVLLEQEQEKESENITPAPAAVELVDRKKLVAMRNHMFEIDTRFGQLGPTGIFTALDRAGVLDHRMVSEEEIDRAMSDPPQSNRAMVRGEVVRRLAGSPNARCDWQFVSDNDAGKLLDLSDPFTKTETWGTSNSRDLLRRRAGLAPWFNDLMSEPEIPPSPLSRRERAYSLYERGDYRGAEELLRGCVAEGFEVASNRCHLARALMLMDREQEARAEVALAWEARADAESYVVPRILYFHYVFALLDRADPAGALCELLRCVREGGTSLNWTILPMLEHLRTRLRRYDYLFLRALAGALSETRHMGDLNRFRQMREAESRLGAPPLSSAAD
jgi:hypothetical protein